MKKFWWQLIGVVVECSTTCKICRRSYVFNDTSICRGNNFQRHISFVVNRYSRQVLYVLEYGIPSTTPLPDDIKKMSSLRFHDTFSVSLNCFFLVVFTPSFLSEMNCLIKIEIPVLLYVPPQIPKEWKSSGF